MLANYINIFMMLYEGLFYLNEGVEIPEKLEDRGLHTLMYLILIPGYFIWLIMVGSISLIVLILCFVLYMNYDQHRRRRQRNNGMGPIFDFNNSEANRNHVLLETVKQFPFGDIVNREGEDCPICLTEFNDEAQVT